MVPLFHIVSGLLVSILLYPYFGLSIIIIFFSSFLIDIDHIFWYIFKYKKYGSLKEIYKYYTDDEKLKDILNIFHTVEFLILITALAFLFRFFLFVLIGVYLHYTLDIIYMVLYKKYGRRAMSLIGWSKRNL